MRHMQVTPQGLAPGRCSGRLGSTRERTNSPRLAAVTLLLSVLYGMQSFLHLTNAGVVAPNRLELPADCTHTSAARNLGRGIGRGGAGGRGWEAG